jgi:prepilin-type processing-associated H-X9-DG protein
MSFQTLEQMHGGKANYLFGDQRPKLLDELNEVLAA